MRLDHLLSRESDILTRLDLDEMDRENEFQDCSILKVLPLEQLCCEIAKRCGNGRSEERVRSLIRSRRTGGNESRQPFAVRTKREKPSEHKGKLTEMRKHGGIAQMGEHLLCKQGVKGSNPFISTIRCFEIFSQGKISETSHPAERPTGREVGLTG